MVKGLTPYQGRKRCYGIFDCMCYNTWASAYSWANTPQMCIECDMWVYPDYQYKLKYTKSKSKKIHLQPLCGKCKYNIRSCTEH